MVFSDSWKFLLTDFPKIYTFSKYFRRFPIDFLLVLRHLNRAALFVLIEKFFKLLEKLVLRNENAYYIYPIILAKERSKNSFYHFAIRLASVEWHFVIISPEIKFLRMFVVTTKILSSYDYSHKESSKPWFVLNWYWIHFNSHHWNMEVVDSGSSAKHLYLLLYPNDWWFILLWAEHIHLELNRPRLTKHWPSQ